MIVTEHKLMALTGYTKGQIRRRRELFWTEKICWKEPGGATVFNLREVRRWQRESQIATDDAGSDTSL